jgi:hypothetical protein
MAKNFTLQDVTITLQGNENEMLEYFNMPPSYTICGHKGIGY